MKWSIITKTKTDGFFADAIREYEKRLRPYCKIEMRPGRSTEGGDSRTRLLTIANDGERISSEDLSGMINEFSVNGVSEVVIITRTGFPSYGEPAQPRLHGRAVPNPGVRIWNDQPWLHGRAVPNPGVWIWNDQPRKICVSQMDVDERLMVVILYEQIYRGYRILRGEPYHR